jgi:cytochrome oxidase Cu insertion factor (SCO1/SenC/PrrC family)
VEQNETIKPSQRKGRWKLLAVLLVCAAPMLGSYLTYYVIKPSGRTNYGALLDPRQYPIPALGITALDGKPTSLEAYKGQWIMLQTGSGACLEACRKQLFAMRQLRLMQGKDMERLERVWLITDAQPLETTLMREFDGTRMLRVQPEALARWLPVEAGGDASEHMYLIDPLGNLMMRFPKDADPAKVKKDIAKLLKASAIG